jgi:aryl-alcohol dehydrogenase-like predicted oxidoreductase
MQHFGPEGSGGKLTHLQWGTMKRRAFLAISPVALGARLAAENDPMPMATLGKTGLRISRFVLGGAHMAMRGDDNGVDMVHRAIDLGVTFFDSAHLYNNGRSDRIYGQALKGGLRQKVLLMSKAERRDRDGAMRQLEETLQRMQTDYLDLWQCHQVVAHAEVDQIFGPNGALEAFVKAKEQGKVRHIGFTGHQDPSVLQRLLDGYAGWENVQHPVNLIDPHYGSFILSVLPNIRKKGLGLLAMKSNAMGPIVANRIATIQQCLRFTLSQDVDAVVSGPQTLEELEENIAAVKAFKKMTPEEISALLARTAKGPHGPEIERYKRASRAGWRPHVDGETA